MFSGFPIFHFFGGVTKLYSKFILQGGFKFSCRAISHVASDIMFLDIFCIMWVKHRHKLPIWEW